MAMNFPNSPSIGAIYQAPGGPVYKWDGAMWLPQVGSGVFLEKANNLSDLTDKAAARNNLEIGGWRTIAKMDLAVDTLTWGFAIPADIRIIRASFAMMGTVNDQNLNLRWGRNADGTGLLTGASDYSNTYDWVNNATTLNRTYQTGLPFGIIAAACQANVFQNGSFDLSPGADALSLPAFISQARNTNSGGNDQLFHGSARSADSGGLALGRRRYIQLFYGSGNIKAGSYCIVEGAS